jgi:hypothetical protein
MPQRNEDPDITAMRILAWCALAFGAILLLAGAITVGATATDPDRVVWQGAGYTCIVWTGIMVVAWGALTGHARIMERDQRHHETMLRELHEIRDSLRPVDEMANRRRGHTG